ncbi:MAG TPA: hypothetical protein VE011_00480 [Candidatus Dormibacteraeota bacterium]|nr:hypothetical protein [Candidatus Dormibacteraeota bacterium]
MANRRQAVEAALAGWREAERKLAAASDDRSAIRAELERYRDEYQRLSSDSMSDRIEALREAEGRRSSAVPSTHPFHQAAQDERAIAGQIWEEARSIDEDTPQTRHGEPAPSSG